MDSKGKVNKTTVKYKKKDGTEVIKEYKRIYIPVEKENKITQKKLLDKVKDIKKEDYEAAYKLISDFINRENVQPNEQEIMP